MAYIFTIGTKLRKFKAEADDVFEDCVYVTKRTIIDISWVPTQEWLSKYS